MNPYCVVGFKTSDGVVSGVGHRDHQHVPHVRHGCFIDVVLIAVEGESEEDLIGEHKRPETIQSVTHQRLIKLCAVLHCKPVEQKLLG